MSHRQQAYALIDRLDPHQLSALVQLLQTMLDDEDDELSEADRQAVIASREYFRQNPGGGVPFEQMVSELGFTMDQIRSPKDE